MNSLQNTQAEKAHFCRKRHWEAFLVNHLKLLHTLEDMPLHAVCLLWYPSLHSFLFLSALLSFFIYLSSLPLSPLSLSLSLLIHTLQHRTLGLGRAREIGGERERKGVRSDRKREWVYFTPASTRSHSLYKYEALLSLLSILSPSPLSMSYYPLTYLALREREWERVKWGEGQETKIERRKYLILSPF